MVASGAPPRGSDARSADQAPERTSGSFSRRRQDGVNALVRVPGPPRPSLTSCGGPPPERRSPPLTPGGCRPVRRFRTGWWRRVQRATRSGRASARGPRGSRRTPAGPEPLPEHDARTMLPPMATAPSTLSVEEAPQSVAKVSIKYYERELARLQVELVKQQEYVRAHGLRVVVVFEGRDAAGKGGAIQRITETLNPRAARIVALTAPTERERGQWYFQRYVGHLPARGEMVLLDRSWYNRAGVEWVMGFCTEAEYEEFLRSCPEFERMLVRSGILLVKYWFSVSDSEQEKRFQARLEDPTKRWKLSPMDLEARNRWVEFSRAKDVMFAATDIPQAPWWVVEADDKKRARLNVITHLLGQVPYADLIPEAPAQLPPRPPVRHDYVRPPKASQRFVPDVVPVTAGG